MWSDLTLGPSFKVKRELPKVKVPMTYLSRANGIIGRDLKFAGYVHHYKILTENIFGLILKNKMTATGVSFHS